MYRNNVPVSEKPDKRLIIEHQIGSVANNPNNASGYYRFVSIDPGEKNLALRIEYRSYDAN